MAPEMTARQAMFRTTDGFYGGTYDPRQLTGRTSRDCFPGRRP